MTTLQQRLLSTIRHAIAMLTRFGLTIHRNLNGALEAGRKTLSQLSDPKTTEAISGYGATLLAYIKRAGIFFRKGLDRLSGRLARFTKKTKELATDAMDQAGSALQTTRNNMQAGAEAPNAPPVPQTPRITRLPDGECVYAIGDIHGRFDLLEQLITSIETDARRLPAGTRVTIVFLGDYIDRGMQSRQVIDYIMSDKLQAFETVFLMGNHEEALLQFRNDHSFGPVWARYGGIETLFSYGLQPPRTQGPFGPGGVDEVWHNTWNEFRTKLPDRHLQFYQSLTHYFQLGDYVFVHAGLRPNLSLEEQSARDMLWIRDEFLNDPDPFEQFVVHGHTPTDEVVRDNRRIGLDTGAYYSGQLTAARFFGTEIAILST